METGQLFIMPMSAVSVPPAVAGQTPAHVAEGNSSSSINFAALLESVAPLNGGATQGTKNGETAILKIGTEVLTETVQLQADALEVKPEIVASLQEPVILPHELTSKEVAVTHDKEESSDLLEEESTTEQELRLPQEVVLDAAGAQLAQTLQISGRTPEPEQTVVKQSMAAVLQPVVETSKQVSKESSHSQLVVTASNVEAPVVKPSMEAKAGISAATEAPVAPIPSKVTAVVKEMFASANEVETVGKKQNSHELFSVKPAVHVQQVQSTPGPDQHKSSNPAPWSALDDLSPSSTVQANTTQQKAPATTSAAQVIMQQIPVVQIMDAYSQPVATKTAPLAENLAVTASAADVQPVIKHAVETGTVPSQVAAKVDESPTSKERTVHVTTPFTSRDITAGDEVLLSAAVKEPSSVTHEDGAAKENSLFDLKMTGHLQNVTAHQATNTAVSATSGSIQEQTQLPAVGEHVVKQLGERIAAHEIKSGSDQIVLRLTPENLGELKVNLKMENQRLTVEIVTESKTVTDALRQNSDSLRETLAKQNIKMDSFDVSTGSNGQDNLAGRNGRNLGEWQETARNRQANQWQQGGYSIPVVASADNATAYSAAPHRHGLVDVHS